MSPMAYYNEFDPKAAAWLMELVKAGLIAPGIVDTRSITEVLPSDLTGFTQCHFFAGVGVWSHALRSAGWRDDEPVWTGSCPCQPFSSAGKGAGFADERHLWPAFYHLILHGKPREVPVFGEQVASKDGLTWLGLVQADMEGAGYSFGAVDLCAAGVGAPHIRQRLYWVADTPDSGYVQRVMGDEASSQCAASSGGPERWEGRGWDDTSNGCRNVRVADTQRNGLDRSGNAGAGGWDELSDCGAVGGLADTERGGLQRGESAGSPTDSRRRFADEGSEGGHRRPGPTNGFWRDVDWLYCTDGKWRPVEASPQSLVDGSTESLGRVRPEILTQIEEEVNAAAMETEIRRPEVLRILRETLSTEAGQVWKAGRLPRLHEAPFLLAFLRQLQAQGWPIAQDHALLRTEAPEELMRGMRCSEEPTGSSYQRGLDGQSTREPADVVHFLSSLLARFAPQAWGHAYETYAEIGFPLGHNAPARAARLRGYGNAINAEVAQAFIEAYMETLPAYLETRL